MVWTFWSLCMLYTVATDAEPSLVRFERRRRRREQVSASQSVTSHSVFSRGPAPRAGVRSRLYVSAITFQIKFITAMMHPRCTRHYTGNSYLSDSV